MRLRAMDSERWRRIDALYHVAVTRDGTAREAFLEEVCAGDPALRQELESLLQHGEASHAFFDTPAPELAVDEEHRDRSLIGTRLGAYEITGLLGAGGMGRVYRARDTRLGRSVAIKILDEGFSKRFEREARAIAALNHPNVCTLHDIGPNYLVMELVEGESLASQLRRGPLARDVVLQYGIQIAEALSDAHAKGIVHRDLKPENVLITGGQPKLVDFGLALVRPQRDGSDDPSLFASSFETRAGAVLGTLAYMSPEQVRGESTDARTDLFSLGAVLYEAATGTRAFARDSSAETIAAILKEEPPPILSDAELDGIIRGCLVKDADHRTPNAAQVASALRNLQKRAGEAERPSVPAADQALSARSRLALMPGARRTFQWVAAILCAVLVALGLSGYFWSIRGRSSPLPPIRSLMVLPLDNISAEPGQDYLADGMTEALTTELAKVESLRVISRTTARQFKRAGKPLLQIGHDLGIDAVLEGSVARLGSRVRVSIQLIQVNPESHLWAEVYERNLSDAFGLESDVTNAVVGAIEIKLSSRDRARLGRRRPVQSEAFEVYLRARYYESGAAGLATERAIDTYKKAIELDPGFTAARAGLARAYIFGVGLRPKVALATARETALKAMQLDPAAPEALLASAITRLYYEHDFGGSAQEFQRALEANPGNPDAHFYYSQCLAAMGRFDEAIVEARGAQRLDPLSPLITHYIGRIHYFGHRYDKSIETLNEALDIDPNYAFTHVFMASTYERMHDYDRALEHRQTYMSLVGAAAADVAEFGAIGRRSGYKAALRFFARRSAAATEQRGYLTSSELAYVFAALGERDTAIGWLKRAVDDHVRDLIYLKVEPAYDALRGDQRFAALARQVIPQ
jgi:serine/threonine-protein kinase